MTDNPTRVTKRGKTWDMTNDPKDRRDVERVAEADRENVENVPKGRDIQDLVGGQEEEKSGKSAGREG